VPRTAAPWPIPPMLAKAGPLPRGGGAWAFEFKWDGYRTLLHVAGGNVRAQSRNLHDVTGQWPELQALTGAFGRHDLVLDGELVVLDDAGRPSFGALQQRTGMAPKGSKPASGMGNAATFLAFDLLWLDGKSLMAQPWQERRAALEGLALKHEGLWVPPVSEDGEAVEEASTTLGLEGVVAKRRDSLYKPGIRTEAWVKAKRTHRQEFVVGGFTRSEAAPGHLAALLLGYYDDDGKLVYAGRVGTGFTARIHQQLLDLLEPLARRESAFAPDGAAEIPDESVFVEPRLVCEVQFTAWTHDGHLRLPSYKGLRADKDASEVRREP
jgi:bifunctional non-homologous end joining protein LigD